MVGAGALGCELLKLLCLLGVGKVTVVDADSIEISNISRQFLFRNENIGQNKAAVAVNRAKLINPEVSFSHIENFLNKANECFFNAEFWKDHTTIFCAVDNAEARRYLSKKSKEFSIPLFESGTEGLRNCHQVIIPKLTAGYYGAKVQIQEEFNSCTIKSFPYAFKHTIAAAVNFYKEFFEKFFEDINALNDNAENFLKNIKNLDLLSQNQKVAKTFLIFKTSYLDG